MFGVSGAIRALDLMFMLRVNVGTEAKSAARDLATDRIFVRRQ
jgi:hypothetical protein